MTTIAIYESKFRKEQFSNTSWPRLSTIPVNILKIFGISVKKTNNACPVKLSVGFVFFFNWQVIFLKSIYNLHALNVVLIPYTTLTFTHVNPAQVRKQFLLGLLEFAIN